MLEQRIQQQFIDGADLTFQAGPTLSKPIALAVQAILACVTSGGKVVACGAGPSGLLAAHFVAHFVGRFERDRPGLAALALPSDPAELLADTAEAGDADRFARQVRALGESSDVLLALSASGDSATVLAAVLAAHEREMTVVALLGGQGGAVARALRDTDVQVTVPHERASRVHEVHMLVLHSLCDGVDAQLLGDQEG